MTGVNISCAVCHDACAVGLTLDVQVSMTVLPKPMIIRPPMTRPKESWLELAAETTAPRKMATEQTNEPLIVSKYVCQ